MKAHLHFTFGPVQGFVAQARRTRDLYAGSFLLSHLAITAMQAAQKSGGEVILPDLDSLKLLTSNPESKHALAPNRFIAQFADASLAEPAGKAASEALQNEWRRIASLVWENFVEPISGIENETQRIWDGQINHFWEIAWCVGSDSQEDADLLDRRKNWRTPVQTTEGGDHCTLMGQWQELSGFIRSKHRKEQDDFWKAVRSQSQVKALDLEDDERLCAIAMVKRFFPQVSKAILYRELDMQSWPSTVSIAALPWELAIKKQIDTGNWKLQEAATGFAERVQNENGATVSSARRIEGLRDFPDAGRFSKLSGNFLNRTALENKRGTPLHHEERRDEYLKALRAVEEASGDRAGSFYALLLMDGDHMGRLIRKYGPSEVTQSLTRFSKDVPTTVAKHDGICIYAGGDDLLAMLPLDRALDAVVTVRELYQKAFQPIVATISAGLVFAHYRCAFSRVLEQAHHLLDSQAKNGAGRDALALAVIKPGGVACRWVGKFDRFISDESNCFGNLITSYQRGAKQERVALSSSFLYNLRERFNDLFGSEGQAESFDREALHKLFVAEYLHGRLDGDPVKAARQREQASELMRRLIHVCQQNAADAPSGLRFDLDGARLVKFLALHGKEGSES